MDFVRSDHITSVRRLSIASISFLTYGICSSIGRLRSSSCAYQLINQKYSGDEERSHPIEERFPFVGNDNDDIDRRLAKVNPTIEKMTASIF